MQSIRTQNHRFYYSFYANNSQKSLNYTNKKKVNLDFRTATFKPFIIQKSALYLSESLKEQAKFGLFAKFLKKNPGNSFSTITKWALCFGTVSLFALPVKGFLTPTITPTMSTLDSIVSRGEIVMATVKNNGTIFNHDDIQHGFGYDTALRYADNLGVNLNLQMYDSEAEALNALKLGKVDGLLSGLTQADTTSVRLACNDDMANTVANHGLDAKMSFVFDAKDKTLSEHAKHFLCTPEELALTGSSARFYDQTLLDNEYSDKHFKKAITQKLPLYKTAFKNEAKTYNHDWQVLAVISYQESHLDPNAISRTGVEGLMMLTQDTAKAMGVKNRTNALESIQGGAKYLEVLNGLYQDVPESERLWFVLASYNMGPNAVKRIQSEIFAKGRDGNSWVEVYGYLARNASQNGRYVQCMHYVTNIRTYLETIKTMEV